MLRREDGVVKATQSLVMGTFENHELVLVPNNGLKGQQISLSYHPQIHEQ